MFAGKPRKAIGFTLRARCHAVLVAAFLLNALVPNAVFAMSLSAGQEANSQPALHKGVMGKTDAFMRGVADHLRSAPAWLAPTVAVSVTETPTPEPSLTLTVAPMLTSTPLATQIASVTPAPTSTPTDQISPLAFLLSVAPAQVSPGDEVTFTVTVLNQSKTAFQNLVFSNRLPDPFHLNQDSAKDFKFDPDTNTLTWSAADHQTTLLPGDTLTLQYTVQVDANSEEMQISDSATLTADSFSEPLLAKTALTILPPHQQLTLVDAPGGQATGVNGLVTVTLPKDAVNTLESILIDNLSDTASSKTDLPSLKFTLSLQAPQAQAEALTAPNEQDQLLTFQPVEAKFDQPLE